MLKNARRLLARQLQTVKPKSGGRADIQGLRALAVAAVIADHALHWPSGGFVGVDVFFVISGFLITGLLLREYDRTGTISFKAFYKRRIKRILPAATLVILLTLAASYSLFNSARFSSIVHDATWAALFSANWRFASVGTDYFQAEGPVSPLQHYWSLAVEEQFYFLWPAIMVGILLLMSRRGWNGHGRVAVGAAIALLSIVSFAWSMTETASNPTQAYFSTFSRTWELGVGAFLAIIVPTLSRLPSALRPVLAWSGLAGILASFFVISSTSMFPAPTAALPVIATAMVIMSGTGGTVRGLWPLTNRVSRYTGDISYSLYLVHFPVLIFGAELFDLSSRWAMVSILVAVYVLAVYQYHLFEDWVRKSSWMEPKTKRANGALLSQSHKYTWFSLLALVTAVVVAVALVPSPKSYVTAPAVASLGVAQAAPSGDEDLPPELASLQAQIVSATGAVEWPELSPTMTEAIESGQTPPEISRCGQLGAPVDESACTWGNADAANTAVMVGDSTSMAYVATVREALAKGNDWRVISYGTFGCTFFELPDVAEEGACAERKADAVEAIKRLQPEVVFVTNHYDGRFMPGTKDSIPQDVVTASVETLVTSFSGDASKLVFLAPPPTAKNPAGCYTKLSKPADCMGTVTGRWKESAQAEQGLAEKLGATFIDSREWFCTDRDCPIFVGSTPVKRDYTHITPAYQVKIGPVVLEALKEHGVA